MVWRPVDNVTHCVLCNDAQGYINGEIYRVIFKIQYVRNVIQSAHVFNT